MTTITQQLAAIQHQPTRYEIIATNTKTGRQLLIAYTAQQSRHGLLRALYNRSDDVIRALELSDTHVINWRKPARDGCDIEGWHVQFSGRTKRHAITSGEIDYIGDLNQDDGKGGDP